jgi:hypothetical protein
MHKPSFWRGVIIAALVIIALGLGRTRSMPMTRTSNI